MVMTPPSSIGAVVIDANVAVAISSREAGSLLKAAYAIGKGYGCSRSADSVCIALAADLILTCPTFLLTFDRGLPNQATQQTPSVVVRLL